VGTQKERGSGGKKTKSSGGIGATRKRKRGKDGTRVLRMAMGSRDMKGSQDSSVLSTIGEKEHTG